MQTEIIRAETRSPAKSPYEKVIENSKRVRWDIDKDVLRGRSFDYQQSFMPEGLSKLNELPFLDDGDRRLLSHVQGRTYANVFGLAERFVNAKVLELSGHYWLGDQKALEALVRFSDEELKHQELFRCIEEMMGRGMPSGYRFVLQPNEVAAAVLSKSTWAVLALTCHIELFTQLHYRESIEPDPDLSPLFKDVLLFHWKEESQHAILDELEWSLEDDKLTVAERDRAVDEFIDLVGALDGLMRAQAAADVNYFIDVCTGGLVAGQIEQIRIVVLRAYRWQFILSGAQNPRFLAILGSLITEEQGHRIGRALAPLMG